MTVQERLRGAIETIGETPAAVAVRMGMTRQNIYAILGGRPVRSHFAARFEARFGISQAWLLTGDGEMKVQPREEIDAELPLFNSIPSAPIDFRPILGATFKVPRSYLPNLGERCSRYVLRVNDDSLAPLVLREDHLLMDGRFDLDVQRHGIHIDDQLCAVYLDGAPMLRWVRFEATTGAVQLLKGPNDTPIQLTKSKSRRVKICGTCRGLIWRPMETLSSMEERLPE